MRKLMVLAILFGLVLTGCSVIMATQQPAKKDLSVLSKGVPRPQVVAELGQPLSTETVDGCKHDTFAFKQGYQTGVKAGRAVFHAVADVFTCGLWEVVGTPVEAVANGTDVKVRVSYDKEDRVKDILTYSGKNAVDQALVPAPEVKETAQTVQ